MRIRNCYSRERYGTSYGLAIFALEEIAKGFVFHWEADGAITEADLRELIYKHRGKHTVIHLINTFERAMPLMAPKLDPLLNGSQNNVKLKLDEAKKIIETAHAVASREHLHLLIHAQQRREISFYVDICNKCNTELLGPWLIVPSDPDELIRYAEERLVTIETLVRNCKRHESGIEIEVNAEPQQKQIPFRALVKSTVDSLDRVAGLECKHVLCSSVRPSPQRAQDQ